MKTPAQRKGGGGVSDATGFRIERIEKLLHELEYEVTRGMMDGDLDETLSFTFYVPISKAILNGVVRCEFRTRPLPRDYMDTREFPHRLRVVK